MRCDIRVSSFAPVVTFQLAPQCYVTARFENSPRGTARREVSSLFIIIDLMMQSLVGVACSESNILAG